MMESAGKSDEGEQKKRLLSRKAPSPLTKRNSPFFAFFFLLSSCFFQRFFLLLSLKLWEASPRAGCPLGSSSLPRPEGRRRQWRSSR